MCKCFPLCVWGLELCVSANACVFARVWRSQVSSSVITILIVETVFLISLEPTGIVHSCLLTNANPGCTPSCLEFVYSFWQSNSIPHPFYGLNHLSSTVFMELISTNSKSNYVLSENCHKCTIYVYILTKLWTLLRS